MANAILTPDECKVMEMMGYFYLNMGLLDRAKLTASALIAVDQNNAWARRALAVIAFGQEKYEEVAELTRVLTPENCVTEADRQLCKIKARALYKLGKVETARNLMEKLMLDEADDGDSK